MTNKLYEDVTPLDITNEIMEILNEIGYYNDCNSKVLSLLETVKEELEKIAVQHIEERHLKAV